MKTMRKVFNDDQILLLFAMSCITVLITVGLLMLAFAPGAKGETVVPLVSIGVATIATFVRQPAFPNITPDAKPADAIHAAATAAAAVLDTARKYADSAPPTEPKPEDTP